MVSQLCSNRTVLAVTPPVDSGTISLKPANPSAAAARAAVRPPAEARQHVHVVVRLRPLSEREAARGDPPVWTVDAENRICLAKQGVVPQYAFDSVLRQSATNVGVYESVGSPVVQAALGGINGTIFAYGVTSSGKTYTMLGEQRAPGLVPQALRELFGGIKQTRDRLFLVKLSMLEIYNEVVNDLLDADSTNLRLREDTARNMVFVDGLRTVEVCSPRHARGCSAALSHPRSWGKTEPDPSCAFACCGMARLQGTQHHSCL